MRFFSFLLFILFFSNARAQTFHAGLIAGLNGNQIHGDTYSGFDQAGLVGGVFVCTDPSKTWYFQMEMQYSQKGSKKNPNPEKGDYDAFELRLKYVEVPFLARYNFRKLYFEVGETIGVLAGVREWDDYGEITPQGFRRWESALVLGVGVSLNEHWSIDFRNTNSLFPIKKFSVPVYYQRYLSNLFNKGMYNNVIGLTACYRFGKKKDD